MREMKEIFTEKILEKTRRNEFYRGVEEPNGNYSFCKSIMFIIFQLVQSIKVTTEVIFTQLHHTIITGFVREGNRRFD